MLPEYDKCIEIATHGALKELVPTGLVAIVATFAVGFAVGFVAVCRRLAASFAAIS